MRVPEERLVCPVHETGIDWRYTFDFNVQHRRSPCGEPGRALEATSTCRITCCTTCSSGSYPMIRVQPQVAANPRVLAELLLTCRLCEAGCHDESENGSRAWSQRFCSECSEIARTRCQVPELEQLVALDVENGMSPIARHLV